MRIISVLLVSVVALLAADKVLFATTNSETTASAMAASPTCYRSLRSAKTAEKHDEDKSQEEERGSILTVLDDMINPKTVEQLVARAAREKTEEFYHNLINSKVFRENMFKNWLSDGVDKAQALRFLDVDQKTAQKYLDIVDEYEAFRVAALANRAT